MYLRHTYRAGRSWLNLSFLEEFDRPRLAVVNYIGGAPGLAARRAWLTSQAPRPWVVYVKLRKKLFMAEAHTVIG